MKDKIQLHADVLNVLCGLFGKDDPDSRRNACLLLCETAECYNAVIEQLASQSLLDAVYIPNSMTGREMLYPVLHYGTLKLVRGSSAEYVIKTHLAPRRRQ